LRRRSFNLRWIFAVLLVAFAAVAFALPSMAFGAPTIVSLTFDDGWDSQQTAYSMLAAHGLRGTFYVNSSNIDQPGYLTWAQLTAMNAAGNEVGGHTLTHPDLTTLTAAQAQTEICQDRTNIRNHGFVVPDFAYPFGAYDANTGAGSLDASTIVQGCGYSSGRGAFGLHNITATNDTRPYATSTSPSNKFKILTPCCINYASFNNSTPTAAGLQSYVQHAESGGGGWVIFFFHRICDNCGGDSPAPAMSPSEFNAFLDWLAPSSSGATVRTVAQVIKNDTQAPTTSIACGGTSCSAGSYSGPVSVSLSASDGGSGVATTRYTTDGSDPTAASPLYTAPFTVSATTVVKYRSWDNANNLEATKSQTIQVDTTPATSSIACNLAVCSSGWYGTGVSVSLSASDTGSGVASIHYTTDGSNPTLSSPTYTAPFSVSTTTTVKYRAWDNAGNVEPTNTQTIQVDGTAPTSSIACNGSACSGWYGAGVSVSLSASDTGSGVASIHYTTDGSDPTLASPTYTAPFSVSTTTTVKYRAWDAAGNVEATNSQVVQVDTTAPASSIACNGSACSSSAYSSAVAVTLSATDAGSGVASIHYTTDGSDPSLSSPTYTAPFSVSSTTTVKYRAWDNAGNAEATNSQTIQVDTTAPTSSIACNGSACSGWYGAGVSVSLSASDTGSGVASIHYTTDGSDPTLASPTYSAPFSVSSTTTVKYRAWDSAGNAEATNSQVIQVDTTAPTSSIACNGSACSSSAYSSDVAVTLSASDGESGVSVIRYTLDGSDPTASSTAYSGSFSVSATTTVKYRAWDNAGNVEATNTQLIIVTKVLPDTTPPTSSIACNGTACTSGWYTSSVSVSLSASDTESGVASIHYTTDGSDPTLSSPTYTAPFGVSSATTVKYRAWDNAGNVESTNTQVIQVDTTAPTSSIACNGSACSGWYGAGVSVSLSASDTDSGVDSIHYTTDGTNPTLSSPTYTAPFSVSSTTTVKYRAFDVAGNAEATKSQTIQVDTTAPTSSIACNGAACSGSAYSSDVTVTLSASDGESGLSVIRYTLDGSDPTASSTAYSGSFSVSATTTVKYRAWDTAGNVEATKSQLITVTKVVPDTTPPTSSIACNLSVCSTGWYSAAVSVSLSASDGGSGVASIHYTTDGSDPTLSSPAYTAPFSVSSTTTVKYRAWDKAGNVEPTNTQLIRIDNTAPTSSITCNGSPCSPWYNASVTVALSATDTQSGVASIHYTTDGSTPTLSSPTYTAPFTVTATTTVKFRAWDTAGNVGAIGTQLIQLETVAPTVTITSPTSGATVTGNVKLAATASDNSGGSGVAQVSFYVDNQLIGTATTATKGSYSVTWNTKKTTKGQHTLTAVARDVAGNSQTSAGVVVTVT
jgi:N-acetyl-beta-hexosaminidase